MANEKVPFLETFRSLVITNGEGMVYNITSMVSEVSIYSDLFSNTVSGEVLMAESQGGIPNMDVKGHEKLSIEIYQNDEVVNKEFYIYSVSDRYGINAQSEVYKLHFVSLESIINENTRLYQAYNGTHSSSVKSAFRMLESTKPIDVQDTVGNFKTVMPGWTPFKAINWYCGRSKGTDGSSMFLLYERMDGFKFRSVESILSDEPNITLHQSPTASNIAAKDPYNIREYEIEKNGDTLSGFNENNTTLWNNDLIRKKIVKNRFESAQPKNGFDIDLKSRRDIMGSNIMIRNESEKTHTSNQDYNFRNIQSNRYWMRALTLFKMRSLLHGDWSIDAGMVVNVELLAKMLQTKSNKVEDSSINGKHLVTAVRYIMKPQEFHMTVETVKIGEDSH